MAVLNPDADIVFVNVPNICSLLNVAVLLILNHYFYS